MNNITVEVTDQLYSFSLLRAYPSKLFIFGDNTMRIGKGGQAVIRDEPNAMGIATKNAPTNEYYGYMSDHWLVENRIVIDADIAKIVKRAKKNNNIIVFPINGIGTGMAMLAEKAPKTFAYLNKRLKEVFEFNNFKEE